MNDFDLWFQGQGQVSPESLDGITLNPFNVKSQKLAERCPLTQVDWIVKLIEDELLPSRSNPCCLAGAVFLCFR